VSNTSSILRHPQRSAIERLLVNGETLRNIAERYSVSKASLHRHKHSHLAKRLARAEKAHEAVIAEYVEQERASATDLLALVDRALTHAEEAIEGAKAEGKWGQASTSIREFTRAVELLARLRGELTQGGSTTVVNTTVNFTNSPDWPRIRSLIFRILEGHPALQERFRDGLRELVSTTANSEEAL
jgi:hypothetical protein